MADSTPLRVRAGAVADFELNKFRVVNTDTGSIGVVRTADGFHAVLNRCPHMGAPICVGSDVTKTTRSNKPFDYSLDYDHDVVRCPWHRWEFRLDTGESAGGTTKGRLMRYVVEDDEEQVFVLLKPRPVVTASRQDATEGPAS